MTDAVEIMAAYTATRDPELRERLLIRYLPLVRFVVGRLAVRLPSGYEKADLESYGVLGLLEALDRFDSTRGVQFQSFASVRIRGAVLDFLRSAGQLSRGYLWRARRLEDALTELRVQLGREPAEDELAQHLGVDLPTLCRQLSETAPVLVSLSDQLGGDEGNALNLAEVIADANSPDPADAIDDEQTIAALADAIDLLPERERLVVGLYYHDNLTMREIASVLGVTEPRVSQLHTTAVLRLRSTLRQQAVKEVGYVA